MSSWTYTCQDGLGEQIYANASSYKGEWQSGFRHGRGQMKYMNGSVYTGQWDKGRRHGEGEFLDKTEGSDSEYRGAFHRDLQTGSCPFRISLCLNGCRKRNEDVWEWFLVHRSPFLPSLPLISPLTEQGMFYNGLFHRHGLFHAAPDSLLISYEGDWLQGAIPSLLTP